MVERRQVIELWNRDPGGVLVTLVRVEGSSYRRPGARLLTGLSATVTKQSGAVIGQSGTGYAGTISGGCLETDVVRRAAWKVRQGAVVERYTMAFDDTAEIPFGLGCGGTVDLLLEPADSPEALALKEAMQDSLQGRESTVVTFLPGGGRGLRRLILGPDGETRFASPALSAEKIACARGLEAGRDYEGRFVERLQAPQRLIVLGAGDDAKPLVRLAAMMGWTVLVGDGRAQLARPERFPEADAVYVLNSLERLHLRREDAVVLMTHSYEQDRALLVSALPYEPRYLGLLGSRHRSSLLITEAAAMLGRTVEECAGGVFAPVGMDLGGDGPEAIALSILSEVQPMSHGKAAGTRRLLAGEIARQVEQGGASRYLQTQCAMTAAGE